MSPHSKRWVPRFAVKPPTKTLLPSVVLALCSSVGLPSCSKSGVEQTALTPTNQSGGDQHPREEPRAVLDSKTIVFSLRGEEEAFRKCFMRNIGDHGRVTVRFDVGERGIVEQASVVESTLADEKTVECIRGKLLEHQFSEAGAVGLGRWTFVFRLAEPLSEKDRKRLLYQASRDTRPSVYLDKAAPGEVDTSKVDEIVQARYPLYAHCYRDSIARAGEAGGILRLRFSIDTTGAVTEVEDAGSVLPDPFALDCMAEAFYAMAFPPSVGGAAKVHYRLDLQ